MSAIVADLFATRYKFRKAVFILEPEDHHGALAYAEAVLLALGFVDRQKSHLFTFLFLTFRHFKY
jgi:hypothetical protein